MSPYQGRIGKALPDLPERRPATEPLFGPVHQDVSHLGCRYLLRGHDEEVVGDLRGTAHPVQFVFIPKVMVVGKNNPLQSLGKDLLYQVHSRDPAAAGVFRGVCVHFNQHGDRIADCFFTAKVES